MQNLVETKAVYDFFKRAFEIPQNWDYPKFSSVVQVNPRTKIDSEKVLYIPMDAVNIENGSVNYFEERNLNDNSSLPKFRDNDVLFARITPSTGYCYFCKWYSSCTN